MKSSVLKATIIGVGAVILSTVGIFAADTLQGVDRGFSNLAGVRGADGCDVGTVPLKVRDTLLCVDMYEASPSSGCPHSVLNNVMESEKNATTQGCTAVSVPDVVPWNYVSLSQAQRVCAASGKRLPTSDEWYAIVLGTVPDSCIINTSGAARTGSPECVSTVGAHDAVGNVWEWVDENVIGNTYDGRPLPQQGYVTSVDADGIAITSGEAPDELYGKDYFWSQSEGVFGMIRGGFYGSGSDAGLYTTNASVPTSFATQGVGFRCVEDVL